jgi:hypothetical protein
MLTVPSSGLLILVSVGKRSLGRPERNWEDNIKTYLREISCDDVRLMELIRVVYIVLWPAVLNLRVPLPQCKLVRFNFFCVRVLKISSLLPVVCFCEVALVVSVLIYFQALE